MLNDTNTKRSVNTEISSEIYVYTMLTYRIVWIFIELIYSPPLPTFLSCGKNMLAHPQGLLRHWSITTQGGSKGVKCVHAERLLFSAAVTMRRTSRSKGDERHVGQTWIPPAPWAQGQPGLALINQTPNDP